MKSSYVTKNFEQNHCNNSEFDGEYEYFIMKIIVLKFWHLKQALFSNPGSMESKFGQISNHMNYSKKKIKVSNY